MTDAFRPTERLRYALNETPLLQLSDVDFHLRSDAPQP